MFTKISSAVQKHSETISPPAQGVSLEGKRPGKLDSGIYLKRVAQAATNE